MNGHEVDFQWPSLDLAIELDGPHHARARTKQFVERKAAPKVAGEA